MRSALTPFKQLSPEWQQRIRQYAAIDIFKDEAKEEIKAHQIDVYQYIDQWLDNKRSEHTKIIYQRAICDFMGWMDIHGVDHLLLVKAEHIDQYIHHLMQEIKPNSVRLKVSAISSFFNMLKRYQYIAINPCHGSPLPNKEYKKAINVDQNKTIPVMNHEEYNCILHSMSPPYSYMILMMAEYGLRIGVFPTLKIEADKFFIKTKGDKYQTFNLLPILNKLQGTPFKKVKINTTQKKIKKLTQNLFNIKKIRHPYSAHDFRHYFATTFYKRTKDIVTLKNLLGHASINVTDIYLQNIGADKDGFQ